jgi:hypothetical protein
MLIKKIGLQEGSWRNNPDARKYGGEGGRDPA